MEGDNREGDNREGDNREGDNREGDNREENREENDENQENQDPSQPSRSTEDDEEESGPSREYPEKPSVRHRFKRRYVLRGRSPLHWSQVDDDPTRPFPQRKDYPDERAFIAAIKKHYNFDIGPPTPPDQLVYAGPPPNERENRKRAAPEVAELGRVLFIENLNMLFRRAKVRRQEWFPPRTNKYEGCRQSFLRVATRFDLEQRRYWLQEQVQNMDLAALNVSNYEAILENFFFGTSENVQRILTIYFFCADVLIRAIRENYDATVVDLYNWSVFYIETHLGNWVESRGGWESFFPPPRQRVEQAQQTDSDDSPTTLGLFNIPTSGTVAFTLREAAVGLGIVCIGILGIALLSRRSGR